MNAFNPLAAMKRLEDSGLPRAQAAIASEIDAGVGDLVTKPVLRDELDAALAKQMLRVGIMTSGIVAVATGVLGVLISIK